MRNRLSRATRGLRISSGITSTRTQHERKKGEPSALKILKEINGFFTEDPARHCVGFGELKDDGSTTCASWIYRASILRWDKLLADRRTPDPPGQPGAHLKLGLGLAGQPTGYV